MNRLLQNKRHMRHPVLAQHGRSIVSFGQDGLELARRKRHRRSLPVTQMLGFLLAVASFKIFLFLDMGASAYGAKIADLAGGNILERIAANAMVLDPASNWVVDGIRFGTW